MKEKYFKLFACCIPVYGYKRSIIYDIQRDCSETIPNSLFHLLKTNKNTSYSKILLKYGVENKKIIDNYFDWLIQKEFGFWCNSVTESKSFPDMDMEWDTPFVITNSIIDIGEDNSINYHDIIRQAINIGIPYLQLRAYTEKNLDFYFSLLKICEGSRIKSIDIFTPYLKINPKEVSFKKNCQKYLRINNIIFHSSPFNKRVKFFNGLTTIIFVKQTISDQNCCGNISSSFFAINKQLFTESHHHNTCLNRKVCIDVNGEIKNCPSMNKSFGNIRNTTLAEAIEKPGFKDLWFINKDKVDVCKDCEFRHMCTDCRAFIKDPENIYSQPSKCPYNPYIAKWQREEGYVSVEECGAYKREKGFVVNKRKVNKLNK